MSTTNPIDNLTEWDELQIKYGNYPARPRTITNEEISEQLVDEAEKIDYLAEKSLKELEKLEDDLDEETLNVYRQRQLENFKKIKESFKFKDVFHISREDYIEEITNASKDNQVVLLHLYTEAKPVCILLNEAFRELAPKHGYVKFCKAVGNHILESVLDAHMPTVLVYYNSMCIHKFLGGKVWGGEDHCNASAVEYVLWKAGVLKYAVEKEDPRPKNYPKVPRLIYVNKEDEKVLSSVIRKSSSSSTSSDSDESDHKAYSSILLDRARRFM